MNNYYPNPMYPGAPMPSGTPNQQQAPTAEQSVPGMFPVEQSFIENILRLNKGKVATFYMSFPDSVEWRDRAFNGVIEAAGRDHIIISNPNTGMWHLLRMIYLDYVDFDEPINYSPTFIPTR